MKSETENSSEPLTTDEEMTLDQAACEFLEKHYLVTGEEGIFVWDGSCYRPRSKLYLENLVFGEAPVQFRDRMFSYLVKNIITRCYCETDRLLSAHCFDDHDGHLMLNCANGIVRWQQNRRSGLWLREEKEVEAPDKGPIVHRSTCCQL